MEKGRRLVWVEIRNGRDGNSSAGRRVAIFRINTPTGEHDETADKIRPRSPFPDDDVKVRTVIDNQYRCGRKGWNNLSGQQRVDDHVS